MIALYPYCRQETVDRVKSANHLYALVGNILEPGTIQDYLARFICGTMEIRYSCLRLVVSESNGELPVNEKFC